MLKQGRIYSKPGPVQKKCGAPWAPAGIFAGGGGNQWLKSACTLISVPVVQYVNKHQCGFYKAV